MKDGEKMKINLKEGIQRILIVIYVILFIIGIFWSLRSSLEEENASASFELQVITSNNEIIKLNSLIPDCTEIKYFVDIFNPQKSGGFISSYDFCKVPYMSDLKDFLPNNKLKMYSNPSKFAAKARINFFIYLAFCIIAIGIIQLLYLGLYKLINWIASGFANNVD